VELGKVTIERGRLSGVKIGNDDASQLLKPFTRVRLPSAEVAAIPAVSELEGPDLVAQAVARSSELQNLILGRPVYLLDATSFTDEIGELLTSDNSQIGAVLKALYELAQLGAQAVQVAVSNPDLVPLFNQVLNDYETKNKIKLPPGITINAVYAAGDSTSLAQKANAIRIGDAFVMATVDQAEKIAPSLRSHAQAVAAGQFLNGHVYQVSLLDLIELTAAHLLFPAAFHTNGKKNILFGEQSQVETILQNLSHILESTRTLLRAA
jgi:hypothetical protein